MKWLTEIQEKASKDIDRITARLAEIDVERKQLIKMRAAFQAISSHRGSSSPDSPDAAPAKDSIKDMAIMLLKDAGRPLALKELHKGMLELGVVFNGDSPKMSIYAALSRNKQLFRNTKDKRWELLSEAPEHSELDV